MEPKALTACGGSPDHSRAPAFRDANTASWCRCKAVGSPDRIRQTFCDIDRAKPANHRPATQRVYRAPNAASGLRVLVAPR